MPREGCYAVHRPEMVRAWHAAGASGDGDVGPDATSPIDPVHGWQPQLWRRGWW